MFQDLTKNRIIDIIFFMKYLKQLFIIITVSLIGELLHFFIPLPIPASIYGLVIMFILLQTRIIKLDMVKETSSYILSIMTLFFVPPCVGFINAFPLMKQYGIQFLIIGIGTTVLVMISTGWVVQGIIRIKQSKKNPEVENNADHE